MLAYLCTLLVERATSRSEDNCVPLTVMGGIPELSRLLRALFRCAMVGPLSASRPREWNAGSGTFSGLSGKEGGYGVRYSTSLFHRGFIALRTGEIALRYALMRAVSGLVLFGGLLVSSCQVEDTGPNSASRRLSDIEAKIDEGQRKLDQVQLELREQTERMEATKVELAFLQCRVKVNEVRAETERRRSECARKLAEYNLCEAKNAKNAGEAGVAGCLLGIAAAAVSGGAAAPWALGGCGVGVIAGTTSATECPVPKCAAELETIEQTVLKEHSLPAMPKCGGAVGAEFETKLKEVVGVRIENVRAGTSAAVAGLAPGDVLTAINNQDIRHPDDLPRVLATFEPGSNLSLTVYRNGKVYPLSTRAATRDSSGGTSTGVALGVLLAKENVSVKAQVGARVTSLTPGSPASGHLRIGDLVVGVSDPDSSKPVEVFNTEMLLAALNEFRPGQEVGLHVVNKRHEKRTERFKVGQVTLANAGEMPPTKATEP